MIMLNNAIRINALFFITHIIQFKHIQVKPKSVIVFYPFAIDFSGAIM